MAWGIWRPLCTAHIDLARVSYSQRRFFRASGRRTGDVPDAHGWLVLLAPAQSHEGRPVWRHVQAAYACCRPCVRMHGLRSPMSQWQTGRCRFRQDCGSRDVSRVCAYGQLMPLLVSPAYQVLRRSRCRWSKPDSRTAMRSQSGSNCSHLDASLVRIFCMRMAIRCRSNGDGCDYGAGSAPCSRQRHRPLGTSHKRIRAVEPSSADASTGLKGLAANAQTGAEWPCTCGMCLIYLYQAAVLALLQLTCR